MKQHMLAIVNESREIFDGPQLLHDVISNSAGDGIAIDFLHADDTRISLTYNTFEAASLRLTQRLRRLLRELGTRRQIVPVVIPQSPELYIAWRAVLQAGACVCPVQYDVPPERLRFIVNDVSADIVLCLEDQVSRLRDILPTTACFAVSLEDVRHESFTYQQQGQPKSLSIKPTDPAYVMYTSGSTGLPKGVIVSHLSITQSLLAHERHIPRFKRFLQFASPTFDVSIFEIFFPFMRGETLVGSSRERTLADLPGTIITLNADAAELTPTVAGTLLRTRDAAPCLQMLLTIGEMLTERVVEEFGGSKSRESMLYAMYGPTEAAVHCTVAPRFSASSSVRNIGKPLDTVTAFVLKEPPHSGSPEIAFVGESGELAVAGQLADGYLNRSDETDTSFIELPGYGQVYRTGDRAKCLVDGTFEFLGRISDGQVKLRGQRVELGEIEEIASKTDGVSMAVAIVNGDQLVLFYESQSCTPADEVQSTCKSWLPPFMRPGEVIMLTEGVPRLSSGKVDKKTLERRHKEKTIQSASSTEPWESDIERMLALQFEQVLGRDISRHSLLWSSGLDSLRAIKVATRLRQQFPNIKVNDILESESVVDLAAQLQTRADSAVELAEARTEPIDDWQAVKGVAMEHLREQAESISKISPCSSMQIALLTETSAKPDLNFNYIKLKTAVDISDIDVWNAFCKLAEGNEILRSGFLFTGLSSMPYVQVVWKHLVKQNLSMLHPLQLVPEDDAKSQLPVLRIHHALYDGWSWELILDDLNSILANRNPPTRPSFEEFASWQRQESRNNTTRNIQYWNRLLADHVRTPFPSLTSSRVLEASRVTVTQNFSLPHSKLSYICAGLQISRQTFLQACWAIVMSAHTDSPDILFGTVASGRHVPLKEIDQVVGPCLLVRPSRVSLSTLRTTKDLLLYLQRQWLDSLDHSSSSLHDIQKSFSGAEGGRLFDTLFVWQEGFERSSSQRQLLSTEDTKDFLDYTAVLEIEPVLDHLEAKLIVDTGIIPVAQANSILQQLDFVLSRIAADMDETLSTIWHEGPEALLSASNPDYTPLQDYRNLTDTIEVLSKQDPTRPALKFVQDFDPSTGRLSIQVLSYGDLYTNACNVSANLTGNYAIQPDKLVAIIAQKSISLYLAIVGTVMSGAGYLCIDPSTPSSRVESILQQAECALVLVDDSFDTKKVQTQSPLVAIESLLHPRSHSRRQHISPSLHHLAYAVFTSGTTGVPKGVLITRKNLFSNISCLSSIYPCDPVTDSLLQACSPAFDVSVFEIFWTWHMGMTLCAAANDVLFRDIEGLIDRLKVTHLSLTPSVAALVNPKNVPKVKMLVTAGEPMNSRVFQSWAGHGNGLYQGYGPSETTNICNVRPNVADADHQNNVGPAFPNTSIFVCVRTESQHELNSTHYSPLSLEDFRLLPKGAIGEVWIGGEQVARGYTDEALTAQNFLQHPSYGRLYRSGDVGRLLSDDSLVILGRTDDQAKIRGQRVELGEINAVLLEHNMVRDAFSLVDGKDGTSRLLSFCAVSELDDLQAIQEMVWQLFRSLEDRLPTYMVPDIVVLVAEIPLTRQGKVNKEELLERYKVQGSPSTLVFFRQQDQASDWTDLDEEELEVAKALSEAVGVEPDVVQRDSSFYPLGLDSINAILLGQLLMNHGFGRVDVSTILRHPSIKALMPLLKGDQEHRTQQQEHEHMSGGHLFDPDWLQKITVQLRASGLKLQNILPCTDLQQSMLSSSEDVDSRAFKNTLRFGVKGDLGRLRGAWTEFIRRNDLLRCVFVRCPESVMPYAQVVLEGTEMQWHNGEASLRVPDLDDILPITPFRISTCPTNEGTTELKVDIHHALYDAEAISSLIREVEFLYWEQPLLPPCSFESYVAHSSSLDTKEVQDFWGKTLQGVVPCRLANRSPGENVGKKHDIGHASKTLRVTLKALESSAHGQAASTLSVVQCALARLLMHVFDRRDVCFGNVFSGRNLPIEGISRIFGPVFNTLPIRAQAKRSTSNHRLVTALHDLNLRILPLQPSSLREIQRLYSPDGRPLFDMLLLLQQEQPALDADIWNLLEDKGDMSFPFILEISPGHQHNEVTASLHSEVAEEQVLKSILDCFDDLLQHCVLYPQALAMDFSSMLSSPPLQQSRVRPYQQEQAAHSQQPENPESDLLSHVETIIRDMMLSLSPLRKLKVSRQTSLFNMGLDSINAVQVAAQLRKLGYEISSSDILEAPKIFEIAVKCMNRSENGRMETAGFNFAAFDPLCRSSLCESERLDTSVIEFIRPCTATQSGILTQYLKSEKELYFNNTRLRLAHDVDFARLRKSWEIAMQRHEMLRTGFAECNVEGYFFVMVTYQSDAIRLPWEEGASQDNERERLVMPQWRLRLSSKDGVLYLDISMLHALYDAQSLGMILGDVANHYLGDKVPKCIDIAPTIASILGQSDSEEAKLFWMEEQNAIQPTKFPDLNIYRAPQRTSTMITKKLLMPLGDLQHHAARLDCSLQTICEAAWAKLLAAYTGQTIVTFGLVLSGRTFDDSRDRAAFICINTTPYTVDVGIDSASILRRISKLTSRLSRFQHTPLASIKRWQSLEAEPFDTILVLQKFESFQPRDTPWVVVEDSASAEYAVSLEILLDEGRNEMVFRVSYSEHVLPMEAAELMLNQLDCFINDIVNEDQYCGTIADLSIRRPKHELLPSSLHFLHEMVEQTARRIPKAPALEFVRAFDGPKVILDTWSYADLDTESNRIAHLLIQHGAKTGEMVSVCFDKCPQASFAILSVLKAGCAYVAIDPGAPVDRKKFILQDSGSKIVLTSRDKVSDFPGLDNLKVIDVANIAGYDHLSAERPILATALDPQHTCYCLYTSGTTGQPKGCLISHESAVQAMLSFERIFQGHWSPESRWLQFASFHFDVSVLEQYWSWYVGIRVTSAPRDLLFEDIPGFIRKMKITHLDLTPSLACLLSPEIVPSLCDGVFIVGGEQVSQDIIETWGAANCLYNFYGPSEVTIGCTVRPRVTRNTKPTNIGQQWENVGTCVLAPGTEKPVLRGAIGELCLSGVLVGKGYLNRPELTVKSFVTLQGDGTRVYRTGDLVRLLHDDSFEFLGRIDDQVKLRGQRLEIGEINQVIRSSASNVKGVATIVTQHLVQGKERLVAFVSTSDTGRRQNACHLVAGEEARAICRDLRRHCMDVLPSYMVPLSFLMANFIPLTVNNKIDNKTLAQLYKDSLDVGTPGVVDVAAGSERTEKFRRFAEILADWARMPKARIAPDTSLFELGLDSISAIGLSRKLRAEGFTTSTAATIMKNFMVTDLVDSLTVSNSMISGLDDTAERSKRAIVMFDCNHRAITAAALQVHADEIESVAPCTPLQEGMISKVISSQGDDPTYFTQFHYDLKNNVDLQKLRDTWSLVQEFTSILRTYFVSTVEGFAQVVLKKPIQAAGVEHEYVTWSQKAFTDWIKSARSFSRVIPWRLALSPTWGKTCMTLFIFHGLYDGVSLQLLLEKVAKAYGSAGKEISDSRFYDILPYGPLRQEHGARDFWSSRLSSIRRLPLQSKYPAKPSHEPFRRTAKMEVSLADLGKLCIGLKITSSALFLAAWLLCLERTYGVNPSVGLVVSGRSVQHDDAEAVIGPMFNTVPCAIDGIGEDADLLDLAKACHRFNVDMLPFQHTALKDISKWTGKDPRNSLFDHLFVFQRESKGYEYDFWKFTANEAVPDYPLNLEVEQKLDGSFVLTLVVKQEYLDRSDEEALLSKMTDLLERASKGERIALPDAFTTTAKANEAIGGERTTNTSVQGTEADVKQTGPTATTIRKHFAVISGVQENKIGLNRPSLFELGLDSIDVMKLATRLRNEGLTIPVSKIMQMPTVGGICQSLERRDDGGEKQTKGSVSRNFDAQQSYYRELPSLQIFGLEELERILPVTPMQEGLLVDYERYYYVMVFEMGVDVDIQRLEKAWIRVINQQPILRTKFVAIEDPESSDAFLQIVPRPGRSMTSVSQDVSSHESVLEAASRVRSWAQNHGMAAPTLQVRFLEIKGKRLMILGMPHAAYDAWSLHLLHQQVSKAYLESPDGEEAGHVIPYECHLATTLQNALSDESQTFWRKTLRDAQPSIFHAIEEDFNPQPQFVSRKLKVSLSSALALCKDLGVTMQSLGLACWALTLGHYARTLDVCFGLVLSGRTTEGADSLMFPTFNTVLFNSQVEPSRSLGDFLRKVHEHAIRVSEHQHFPLREALKLAGGSSGKSELFNTLFTYQRVPEKTGDVRKLYHEIDLQDAPRDPPYAVNVEMEGRDDGLWWTIATQEGVMDHAEVEAVLTTIEHILKALIKESRSPVLKKTNGNISICGLAPISLEPTLKDLALYNDRQGDVTDDEDWTETESTIGQVLAEISKTALSDIKKTTGFYNLGLDSISAIKVAGLLKKRGLRIPVSKIVEEQTVKKMAAVVEMIPEVEAGRKQPEDTFKDTTSKCLDLLAQHGIAGDDVESVLPAAAGQIYMLDVWAKTKGRLFYPSFWFVVEGGTVREFNQATASLVAEIPILRTSFICIASETGGSVVQVAFTPDASRRHLLPWSYVAEEHDGVLLVTLKLHHALYDAVSLRLMITELERLCSMDRLRQQEQITKDVRHFLSLTHNFDASIKAKQKEFWKSYLPAPTVALAQGSFEAPRIELFNPQVVEVTKLHTLLMREGLSIPSLFLAVYGRLYARLLVGEGQSDEIKNVVMGIYLANRSLDVADLPSLAAPTFNVVPLKVNVSHERGLLEVAREVQNDVARISRAENCGVSLREVYEWTGTKLDFVVNFLKVPGNEEENGDEELESDERRVRVRHAYGEIRQKMKAMKRVGFAASPFFNNTLPSESQLEWCIPSIDVEAKVEDGWLGVGVFAPEDMLDEEAVDGMMEETREGLEGVARVD